MAQGKFHELALDESNIVVAKHLVRIFSSKWIDQDGIEQDSTPFFCSIGPDRRLSSEKYNIRMGYWAERVEPCFLEVFLRRGAGEFLANDKISLSSDTLEQYHTAKIILPEGKPIRLFNAISSEICLSAIYSNSDEKDEFVKQVKEHPRNFDGIMYRSNHTSKWTCFAIFEESVKRIEDLAKSGFVMEKTHPMSYWPNDLHQILKAFPDVTLE